jgi:apolipoprotein N-acyltransferase
VATSAAGASRCGRRCRRAAGGHWAPSRSHYCGSGAGQGAGRRALVGANFGVGWFVPAPEWMWGFSPPGAVLAVVLESAITAPRPRRCSRPAVTAALLALPAALVLAEALRGRWPFGGLPLAGPTLDKVDGPLLRAAAAGGPLLVLGFAAVAGVALAAALERHRALRAVVLVAAIITIALVVPAARAGNPTGSVGVVVVQGGGRAGSRRGRRAPVHDAEGARRRGRR